MSSALVVRERVSDRRRECRFAPTAGGLVTEHRQTPSNEPTAPKPSSSRRQIQGIRNLSD
jgi:hypothetical protein